jgi:hypothetical protein
MSASETQIYYDEKGKPVMVQMGIGEYEKLVARAKEALANKELIQKALSLLNANE